MTIQTNGDDCRESGEGETMREQFEQWYSRLMGTPVIVLKTLRDGDSYMETEGSRLDIAWLSWKASAKNEFRLTAIANGCGKLLEQP